MAIATGNEMTAADWNALIATINGVIGTGSGDKGYVQTELSTVNVGDPVLASQMNAVIAALNVAADHQNSSIVMPTGTQSIGDRADAFDGVAPAGGWSIDGSTTAYDVNAAATTIDTNYGNVDVTDQTLGTSSNTTARSSSWSNTIDQTLRFTFSDNDEARQFFNTGGQIRLTYSHPTGTAHDNDWNDVLANGVGEVTFEKNTTTRAGDQGSAQTIGWYQLTTAYQNIYTGTNIGGSPYTNNDVTIQARRDANSTYVEIFCTLTDDYAAFDDTVASGTNTASRTRTSDLYTSVAPTRTEQVTWNSGGS